MAASAFAWATPAATAADDSRKVEANSVAMAARASLPLVPCSPCSREPRKARRTRLRPPPKLPTKGLASGIPSLRVTDGASPTIPRKRAKAPMTTSRGPSLPPGLEKKTPVNVTAAPAPTKPQATVGRMVFPSPGAAVRESSTTSKGTASRERKTKGAAAEIATKAPAARAKKP